MEKLYSTQVKSLQPLQINQKLIYPKCGATPAIYLVTNQAHIYSDTLANEDNSFQNQIR